MLKPGTLVKRKVGKLDHQWWVERCPEHLRKKVFRTVKHLHSNNYMVRSTIDPIFTIEICEDNMEVVGDVRFQEHLERLRSEPVSIPEKSR